MKPQDNAQPQATATTPMSVPMEQVVPGRERGMNDDELDTEEPCTTPSKRAKTIVGLLNCVLEPLEPGPNASANTDESVDNGDVVQKSHALTASTDGAGQDQAKDRSSASRCQSETCPARGPTICLTHHWWEKVPQRSSPHCVVKRRCW